MREKGLTLLFELYYKYLIDEIKADEGKKEKCIIIKHTGVKKARVVNLTLLSSLECWSSEISSRGFINNMLRNFGNMIFSPFYLNSLLISYMNYTLSLNVDYDKIRKKLKLAIRCAGPTSTLGSVSIACFLIQVFNSRKKIVSVTRWRIKQINSVVVTQFIQMEPNYGIDLSDFCEKILNGEETDTNDVESIKFSPPDFAGAYVPCQKEFGDCVTGTWFDNSTTTHLNVFDLNVFFQNLAKRMEIIKKSKKIQASENPRLRQGERSDRDLYKRIQNQGKIGKRDKFE